MLRKFRILWFVPFVFAMLVASSASAQSPLTGVLEVATCEKIAGWALNANNLGVEVAIHVYDGYPGNGNVPVLAFAANQSRGDVGAHAFDKPFPDSIRDGLARTLTFHVVDGINPAKQFGGEVTIGCEPPPPVFATITGSALGNQGESLTGYASLYSRHGDAWQLVMQAGLWDGEFRFDGLGFDTQYLVTVSAEGFKPGEGQEVVTTAGAEPLQFVLEPLPLPMKIVWHSSRTTDGNVWVLVEVKNNSFPQDQWAEVPASISGPGQYSERSEVPFKHYLGVPAIGQTSWYFLQYSVPSMKDGHMYDYRASIGAVGGETYSPIYASVIKVPMVLGF